MANEHEYRSAYEGLQARYVAHVDRLDVEIKELQQRIAKLEAAARAVIELECKLVNGASPHLEPYDPITNPMHFSVEIVALAEELECADSSPVLGSEEERENDGTD